jgi:serine/threonine protein kinase/Tol biopolymer transport system component
MTPERWQKIKQVFQAALDVDRGARAAFVIQACGDDLDLRKEVEELVFAHEQTVNIMDQSVFKMAAELIEGESESMIGRPLGPYKITGEIGRGGMGEVYMAEDGRLGRRVAVKLLPSRFTFDRERVRRFQQEARAASALNHPNIVTIHEIGQQDSQHFIVTEYIEGNTLRSLLREPPNLNKALDVAVQVANALAAAHQVGIIHRDIKPENIMLRPDGYIKVLDFGLAKLSERKRISNPYNDSMSWLDTSPGMVMGTVSYMSPEQVRGIAVDARTDIFSLGVVIYEMVCGRKPFDGETTSDIIAAILEREPQPIPDDTPYELQRIVSKALAKDREWRYQSVKEMLIDLMRLKDELELALKLRQSGSGSVSGWNSGARTQAAAMTRPISSSDRLVELVTVDTQAVEEQKTEKFTGLFGRITRAKKIALAAIAIILATGLGLWLRAMFRPSASWTPSFENMRLTRITSTGNVYGSTISPDGKYILYASNEANKAVLHLKQLSTGSDVQLVAPASVSYWGFAFTNDGSYAYYHYGDAVNYMGILFRVPILGGTPKKILENIAGGVRFSPDDSRMIFARRDDKLGGRVLVSANPDGSDEQVIVYPNQGFVWTYEWSPDGKTIACSMKNQDEQGQPSWQVIEISADGKQSRPITAPRKGGITGLCWFPDRNSMLASATDESTGLQQLWHLSYPGGEMKRITNDLVNYKDPHIALDGKTLVATQLSTVSNIWLADLDDMSHAKQITLGLGYFHDVCWAGNDKLLYRFVESNKADIWEMTPDGTGRKQLTSEPGNNAMPSTSPDGRYLVFSSNRNGSNQVWRSDSDGRNQKQLAFAPSDLNHPHITPDGLWVVYEQELPIGWTLWKIPIDGGNPVQLTDKATDSWAISPDGKLLAYSFLDEQKRARRINIRPFDGGEPIKTLDLPNVQVEQWTSDGKKLICRQDRSIVLLPLDGSSPKPLIALNYPESVFSFSLSPDGKRLAYVRGAINGDAVLITNFKNR